MQLGLGAAVVPFEITLAIETGDPGADQARGFRAVAPQGALGIVVGQAQFPVIVQVMFEAELEHLIVVADIAVVGLAQVGGALHRAELAIHRRNAAVEQRLGAGELTLQQQPGVGVELPAERRAENLTFTADLVAKALVVLDGQIDAREQAAVLGQWGIEVQAAAVAVPTAGTDLELAKGLGLRLLADDIDHAAGVAASVQAGGGALEHFDALDAGGVRRAVAAPVDGEAVLVELACGEAAYAVVQKSQPAEVVLPRHAACKVQGAVDAGGIEVFEYLGGDHGNALGRVANVRVGLGRAARSGGAITAYGTVGGLRVGGYAAVFQLNDGGGGEGG